MYKMTSWALLLLAGVRLVAGWEHAAPEDFREVVAEGDVLVAFVAPDEPESAALEPEWLSAVAKGKERLVSFDCSGEGEESACDREGVDSLPLIVLFQNGDAVKHYQGPARAEAILNFVARRRRPAVSEILTAEQLSAFKTADETVFVAYLDPKDPAPGEVVADAARLFRDEFSFGTVTDAAVAEAQGVKVPAVVCYKLVDGDTVQFSEFGDLEKFVNWVEEASRPVIGELTVLNRERLLRRGWPMIYLFSSSEAERQQLRKTLYKFARSYYDSLTAVLVDPLEFPSLMGELGLDPNVLPAGAVHQLSLDRIFHYPKDKPLSPSALQQWGLDVYQERIKPWRPPGVTTSNDHPGLTVSASASAKLSVQNIPGVKIKIAGHDEL
ncbi:thioredoxin-like domain-containing protein [Cercophora newfieldiana]|uniref:Thioredoxin-like domain-containing protein n=1 Tax=Cercophora newfieldiana TaxID=92897 RepID=A0AA39Y6W0_9PEZI|nr:thioredoxin-like domain-containing protein [Cercophora newfieldiana]